MGTNEESELLSAIDHTFSDAFLSELFYTNQRTQIILERWSLDAWRAISDLSYGERVRADSLQYELPASLTVELLARNGRQRFSFQHSQHRLLRLDELTGKKAYKSICGSRVVRMLQTLQILPAPAVSHNARGIACLHEKQIHEEPSHTAVAVIERVNADKAVVKERSAPQRMQILTLRTCQP